MKTPTSLFDRPGRAVAVAGAVVAVSATAAIALVGGTAVADEPGRCVQNVNVRSEPDVTSKIVALCESGTAVQVAEARDGFVRLTNLGGWAAQEYVSVNGRAPAPAARAQSSESESEEGEEEETSGDATRSESGRDADNREDADESGSSDESGSDESADDESDTGSAPRAGGGGIGGLLGS